MIPSYKSSHLNSKWIIKSDNINSDIITKLVKEYAIQLKQDDENYNNNLQISDCAIFAPRIGSSLDKRYNLSHLIAFELYPLDSDSTTVNPDAKKQWSYIRYQKLISKLSKKINEDWEKEQVLKKQYKEIRKTYQRKYFCELKNRPINQCILHPTPMPVEVAPLEELQPFFNHLSANNPINTSIQQFTRGVQYNDGRLDLCKQVVGPPHIGKLMESLKNNTHITHFLLGNNIIGSNGAKAIHNFLTNDHKPQIKTWYLAGNEIDSDGAKLLSKALGNDTVCESLWLKRNPIKSEGAKYIGEMLKTNKHIKILDLTNCGLLDEGVKYIFEGLKYNLTVKHLYLDSNGLTSMGANYVSDYFNFLVQNNRKGLTSLWLGINRLDDVGAETISKSLKSYYYIKRLCLDSNRLSSVGLKHLCEALVDKNILLLDVGLYKSTSDLGELPNNIGNDGVPILCEFLNKNKSLQVLSIIHNNITLEGINLLLETLKQNNNLVFLYYEQYGVEVPQQIRQEIKDNLKRNIKNKYGMEYQDFCDNKLRYIKGGYKLKNIDSVYRNSMK